MSDVMPPAEASTATAASRMRWYVVHAYSGMEKAVERNLRERVDRAGMQDRFGQILVPSEEVVELKKYIQRLKYESKHKVAYFLDFHGHSLKKNVFCYGPEYDIWSLKYEKARVLPKLLAAKTETFRMKSCLFKVATFKRSTARAFMLAYIPYCYTIESSVGLFRDAHQQDRPFVPRKWREVGARITEALGEVVAQMVESNSKALQRKEKRLRKD